MAYDGFFTSHQKKRSYSFKSDEDVKNFVGKKKEKHDLLDLENPITIGSYMNEPDLINNRFQLYGAVTLAGKRLDEIFKSYENLSQRHYEMVEEYKVKDAEIVMILLGSAFDTVTVAVDKLRKEGIKAGVITLNVIRPFPIDEVVKRVKDKCKILVADRQDSYGANGGNLSLEVRAAFQRKKKNVEIKSVVYGLGGIDFDVSDGRWLLEQYDYLPDFSYYGVTKGGKEKVQDNLLKKIDKERTMLGITEVKNTGEGLMVKGGQIMPHGNADRIAPGHGACPGCGILVNLNLLLRAIEDPVVLLFQTGCGMIITTAYPKTSFRVPYIHNLFQNGAATMSGIVEACKRRQEKGEIPKGDIVFIMVTGDGGMDIGMGSAIGTALRGHNMIIFEYDNGGYMNTGYQLSYSTPKGAKSATSHVGSLQYGKTFFNKDMPEIMAAANIPYVATVAECNPKDFITKAAKAAYYAKNQGMAYIKALSACPLNWNDNPATERAVIEAAVNCGYFPLYEVEKGITKLNYNHENSNKKMPVKQWFSMMGRTRHLVKEEYSSVVEEIQKEIDERFRKLKEKSVSINIKM